MRIYKLVLSAFLVIAAPAAADDTFQVGLTLPLSGALAEYGQAAKNGVELARTQHPENFQKVSFIYEDSQWDAKTAVSAFNKLRSIEKVSLIYNWGNPTTEAVAPLAERYHLPLIGMAANPQTSLGRHYVIRSTNAASDFASRLAEYLVQQGYKNIGVIIADNSYVRGLFDGLKSTIGDRGSVEIVDLYNLQDQDFRSSISKLRQRKYDALGVFLITGQISNCYRQLKDQGINLPTFGTDFFESGTEIKLANGGMNGAVYTHLGITEQFRADYVSRFNNDYQIAYAGNAYDMAMILGRLFNGQTLSADEIMTRLRSVKDQSGIGGTFSFGDAPDEGPHYHFPVQLKKIVGDKITVIP